MDQRKENIFNYIWKMLLMSLLIMSICGGLYYLFLLYPIPGTDQFTVILTEISLCQNGDTIDKSEGTSNIFPRNTESISVCGHLQVNDPPLYMVADWYYEDVSNLIFREIISNVDQYQYSFTSTLKPDGETFQPGKYGVEFVIGKAIVWDIEFQVE